MIGLAALLLTGCGEPDMTGGLPADLAAKLRKDLAPCAEADPLLRDWCVNEALETREDLSGTDVLAVCERMTDAGARDACLELASRDVDAALPDGFCDRIEGQRLRESCWLGVADQALLDPAATIDALLAACEASGSLSGHCVSHIPDRRHAVWEGQGGVEALTSDMTAALARFPEAGQFVDVGNAIAKAAQLLGVPAGEDDICDLLPEGGAKRGCQGMMVNMFSQGGPPMGGGPGGGPGMGQGGGPGMGQGGGPGMGQGGPGMGQGGPGMGQGGPGGPGGGPGMGQGGQGGPR